MTIPLPLQPHEEARLMASAHARGVTADHLVREARDAILGDTFPTASAKEPCRDAGELKTGVPRH